MLEDAYFSKDSELLPEERPHFHLIWKLNFLLEAHCLPGAVEVCFEKDQI